MHVTMVRVEPPQEPETNAFEMVFGTCVELRRFRYVASS